MRSTTYRLTAMLIVGLFLSTWAQAAEMTVGEAVYHDTSPPLSEMAAKAAPATGGPNREIPLGVKPDMGQAQSASATAEPDGGLQSPGWQMGPTPGIIVSEPGLSEQDNKDVLNTAIVPPDVNGDIGLDDDGNRIYIQYINLVWGVFDVNGFLTDGPFAGNTFWTGFGGFCESNNNGDPIVLYDDQAGRWMFSQFSINEGVQCVAVSETSDPLGPYHRYAFIVTPGGANDYPKMGVWDDSTADADGGQSAYTFTLRDFGGAGGSFSVSAGVMERDQMLLGNAAQFVKFINPCSGSDCIEGQLPPHQAGPTPPANTCPTYWTAVDSGYDNTPHANDGYRNHTLCVDWTAIGSSTYGEGSFVVAGSNFDRTLSGPGTITPVNGGEALDSLSHFTMYRAQYRWFGDNARVVLNTTVDAGDGRAGIRWAETRSADGDSAWSLQQDGTYAPDDGLERWMGSIAQDQAGNIALGYSAAGADLFPAVRYTSRMDGDPAGTMPGGEVSCHEGSGAQMASASRWGDYSSMSVDPTDDCTFWYTQEYYQATGSFDFNTRICSFRFADCGTVCTVDADCDDGASCNGDETCNTGTGACEAGTAPVCDDMTFCNGDETCNEGTDSCDAGTPPTCDDGVSCTDDSCNEGTDSCDNVANDAICSDGEFCTGEETCHQTLDCQPGSDPCVGEVCDEDSGTCAGAGCGDEICEAGEDCNSCPEDCSTGELPGAACGNGICEAGDGENSSNCSADCNSKLNGKPSNRFSCGFDGQAPDGCGDPRCTSSGFYCTETPVDPGSFCCGDDVCEGAEDINSCELDCTPPEPFCGDNIINHVDEDCDGSDLAGMTCSDFDATGGTLSCKIDCSGFDDTGCTNDVCGVPGDICDANADCCSNKCKGKPGNQTCR